MFWWINYFTKIETTYMYAHIHKDTHTQRHTYTNAHIQTYIQTYVSYIHTLMHRYTYTNMDTHTQIYTCTHTNTHMNIPFPCRGPPPPRSNPPETAPLSPAPRGASCLILYIYADHTWVHLPHGTAPNPGGSHSTQADIHRYTNTHIHIHKHTNTHM